MERTRRDPTVSVHQGVHQKYLESIWERRDYILRAYEKFSINGEFFWPLRTLSASRGARGLFHERGTFKNLYDQYISLLFFCKPFFSSKPPSHQKDLIFGGDGIYWGYIWVIHPMHSPEVLIFVWEPIFYMNLWTWCTIRMNISRSRSGIERPVPSS